MYFYLPKYYNMKTRIAEDYVRRFPNTSHRALARKLYNENVELFSNYEDARRLVRVVRGCAGTKYRNSRRNKQEFFCSDPSGRFRMPESESVEFVPYIMPDDCRKSLVLSDIHFPYHSVSAVECSLEHGYKNGVDSIILNGDIMDYYQMSYFMKDPRKRDIQFELDMIKEFFAMLRKEFGDIKIVYKIGNHEERYEKYIMQKAPELLNVEMFGIENMLDTEKYNIDLVKNNRIIKAGKLNIVHGHEFGRSIFNPVNAARGMYLRGRDNIICGHYHQTSEHNEPNINGEYIACWATGCLCDMHPEYRPINKWNQGFATVSVHDGGLFTVNNLKILNGRII